MSLDDFPRVPPMFCPSPVHPLPRLSATLGGKIEIWAKREDCNSGIDFGGNKVRKLWPRQLTSGWLDAWTQGVSWVARSREERP